MAKVGKPKLAKATRKTSVSSISAVPKAVDLKTKKKPDRTSATLKAVGSTPVQAHAAPEKKVSQKLIETIEKRKAQGKASPMFSRPPGRRGRRPKGAVEYTPEHQEEEAFALPDSDQETLEYDTGIRVKNYRDDAGFNMDRFEDYDEELNFDW